jgi:hypothetical protein
MIRHKKALALFPRPRIEGNLVIDGVRFDSCRYDEGSDILAIHVEDERPRHPWLDDTPEGHYVQFALDGSLHDVDLMSPKLQLEQDGCISITAREGGPTDRIAREVIEPLLVDTVWPAEVTALLIGDD